MWRISAGFCVLSLLLSASGCSENSPVAEDAAAALPVASAAGQKFLLAAEPTGAVSVIDARSTAKDATDIVVVGRIGGDSNPWVDGLAAFTLVDTSLVPCNEIEGDNCPTPWDYCCAADLADARLLVKFVGDDGQPVESDARELLGVTELQTVVVQGKAQRDAVNNVSILARNVYVRPAGENPDEPAGSHVHDDGHSHDHSHSHSNEAEKSDAASTDSSEPDESHDP